MSTPIPSFDYPTLQRICEVLADAGTHNELGGLLHDLGIADAGVGSKPKRLLATLSERQRQDRCANKVVAFMHHIMKPVRFVGREEEYEALRTRLNGVLLFAGLGMTSDGRLRHAMPARTLDEARGRADRLRTEWDKSEHSGLANLMKGMFGTFRNTTAHAPKITWKIDEQDALDLLSLASLVHRRLDAAVDKRQVSRTAS